MLSIPESPLFRIKKLRASFIASKHDLNATLLAISPAYAYATY